MSNPLKKMLSAKIAGYLGECEGIYGVLEVVEADEARPAVYPSIIVQVGEIVEEMVGYGVWLAPVSLRFDWRQADLETFTREQATEVWRVMVHAMGASDLADLLTDSDWTDVWLKVWGVRSRSGGATAATETEISTTYNISLLCADMEAEPAP